MAACPALPKLPKLVPVARLALVLQVAIVLLLLVAPLPAYVPSPDRTRLVKTRPPLRARAAHALFALIPLVLLVVNIQCVVRGGCHLFSWWLALPVIVTALLVPVALFASGSLPDEVPAPAAPAPFATAW